METLFERDPLDPYSYYKRMRDEHPIWWNDQLEHWEVFRYDDVLKILLSPKTFSSRLVERDMLPIDGSMIFTDPPRHQLLRGLVKNSFSPQALKLWEGRIVSVVHSLLDHVMAQSTMEVVGDFAAQLPSQVIANILGVPVEDWETFTRWTKATADPKGWIERDDAWVRDILDMHWYFQGLIEQRRREPQDDLISVLTSASIDSERLSDKDIQGFCALLLAAGIETTRELLSNAFWFLATIKGLFEWLHNHPSFLKGAIEEFLRYRAPVQVQRRKVTEDTHVGGVALAAGQYVMVNLGSANRDGQHFSCPDELNILRNPNRHLAFGSGLHLCLGAPLARLEAYYALKVVLERLGEIRRLDDQRLEATGFGLGGVKRLAISFESRE